MERPRSIEHQVHLFPRGRNDAVPHRAFLNGTAEEVVPGIATGQGGTGELHSGYPAKVPKGVLYELKRQYYDTAQASNPVAMGALKRSSARRRSMDRLLVLHCRGNGPWPDHEQGFTAAELRMIDREMWKDDSEV